MSRNLKLRLDLTESKLSVEQATLSASFCGEPDAEGSDAAVSGGVGGAAGAVWYE